MKLSSGKDLFFDWTMDEAKNDRTPCRDLFGSWIWGPSLTKINV